MKSNKSSKDLLLIKKILKYIFPSMKYVINEFQGKFEILISNYRCVEVISNEGYLVLDDGKYSILNLYDSFDGFLPHLTEKINFIYHNGDSIVRIYSPFEKITYSDGYLFKI